MRQIELGAMHRIRVLIRELSAKLEAQGCLSKTEAKVLRLAKESVH